MLEVEIVNRASTIIVASQNLRKPRTRQIPTTGTDCRTSCQRLQWRAKCSTDYYRITREGVFRKMFCILFHPIHLGGNGQVAQLAELWIRPHGYGFDSRLDRQASQKYILYLNRKTLAQPREVQVSSLKIQYKGCRPIADWMNFRIWFLNDSRKHPSVKIGAFLRL